MTTQKIIKEIYKELREKLGQHNHIVEARSMWKWCPDCKKKALTISQPTDQITRFADYRIFCLNKDCNTTQIIKNNLYSKKQSIEPFLFDLTNWFRKFKF